MRRITIAVVLLLGCFLTTFLSSCAEKAADPKRALEAPVVAVMAVQQKSISNSLTLVAEFRPYREIDLMAKVSGYVSKINVDIGDRVQAGQALATLEIPEMADDITRAQASLGRAGADVARAKDEVRRAEGGNQIAQLNYQRLANVVKTKPGLVAQQEIDNAQARSLEAAAQVAVAKSALAAAEQSVHVNRSDEHRVQTMFNYTKVIAPFAGIITRRYAEIGAMVQAGTSSQTNVMPVVRLSQDDMLRLQLPIPESLVPKVRNGFPVQIRVPTLDKTIQASITRSSATLSTATRTMEAQVDVPNGDHQIKPGMFAEVNFQFEGKNSALVAPIVGLEGGGQARRALVVNKNQVIEARNVATGIETSEGAEVLSGLSEGDLIVVSNRSQLKAGMKVAPKISSSNVKSTEGK